jgi:hypothetical protein
MELEGSRWGVLYCPSCWFVPSILFLKSATYLAYGLQDFYRSCWAGGFIQKCSHFSENLYYYPNRILLV